MFKFITDNLRQYILIFFTATIFYISLSTKSIPDENIFVVDKVQVEGNIDINFSRNKYIDKAFADSFKILMSKILLSKDVNKINNADLDTVKRLVKSFQILNETYKNNVYKANLKIYYNENKLKNYLRNKNISFSQPKKISAVFYPVLYISENLQGFDNNFFYNKWNKISIENESINFLLPLEDLDDIPKIKELKYKIEDLNIENFINKYNVDNYVFVLMHYDFKTLNTYLKTKFNNNVSSKNVLYKIENIDNEEKLENILKDLKTEITDIWKEDNIVNLSVPLSIKIKFSHLNLNELNKLKTTLYKINIINNYSLEQINTNYSIFNINYYGNPKKLKTELLNFGYNIINKENYWEINNK